jgi:entericidin A
MKPLMLLTMLLLMPGLAGCNTVEGFGKDLKHLGGSIEKKAEKTTDSSD